MDFPIESSIPASANSRCITMPRVTARPPLDLLHLLLHGHSILAGSATSATEEVLSRSGDDILTRSLYKLYAYKILYILYIIYYIYYIYYILYILYIIYIIYYILYRVYC